MKYIFCSIALLAVVIAGCKTENATRQITLQTVENDIKTHVPIGSSKADVIAFFKQRSIPYELVWSDGQFGVKSDYIETGIIPDVRTDGSLYKTIVGIQIDFLLDDNNSRLLSYSVREVYKGS